MLIIHNLKAAWRNILKYKVQNTISVLCLSVGIICFAFTLHLVNERIISEFTKQFGNEVELTIHENNEIKDITFDGLKQLQKLSCVKEIPFCYASGYRVFESKDKNGNIEYSYDFGIKAVNKSWLRKHNYESTTGKKLEDLKNGDILIDETNIDEQFGPDAKPLEFDFDYGKGIKANDIVKTSGHHFKNAVYVVTDFKDDSYKILSTQTDFRTHEYHLYVTLNDRSEIDNFRESAKKIFPEYEVHVYYYKQKSARQILIGILLIIILPLLGSSILIIGLSGYLKMQFQLFEIRSREIVIRRCNGAKPKQLFALLCSELGIIFSITLIAAILLDSLFSNYLFHFIIYKDGWPTELETSFPGYIIVLTIITFFISVLIAWFRVRNVIKATPNSYISISSSNKSIWNSLMQIVQYTFASGLFFTIIGTYIASIGAIYLFNPNADIDNCKRTFSVYSHQEADTLWTSHPAVEKVARLNRLDDHAPITPKFKAQATQDSTALYISYVFDAELASIFNMELQQSPTYMPQQKYEDKIEGIPVYAKAEEIDSLMKVLKLNYKRTTKEEMLIDSCYYIHLGYSRPLPFYPTLEHAYYIIRDFDKYEQECSIKDQRDPYFYFIISTKEGKAEEYRTDLAEICKKSYETRHADFETIYDGFFKTHKNIVTGIKVCTVFLVISLLCIIITVYSSIALETRGRQKEVAIRKVNGAKTWDIVKMFSRYYVKTLSISFCIGLFLPVLVCIAIISATSTNETLEIISVFGGLYCLAILVIALVTLLTVWQKIYKISHINPALLIKKE